MDVRQYDPAIARWTSLDPVTHHSLSPYNSFDNNPVVFADPSGADSDWKPKVNEDGSVSYIAEEGDSAATLAEQYDFGNGTSTEEKELEIAEGLTNTTGNKKIEAGTEISGEDISDATGSSIMRLDLKSKLANSQRKFDQLVFAIDASRSSGKSSFLPFDYFSSRDALINMWSGVGGLTGKNVTLNANGESYFIKYFEADIYWNNPISNSSGNTSSQYMIDGKDVMNIKYFSPAGTQQKMIIQSLTKNVWKVDDRLNQVKKAPLKKIKL